MAGDRARFELSFTPTSEEMARSWLVEHYRRQGRVPVRTLVGVGIVVMAVSMLVRQPSTMGWIALAWGGFLLLRPLAFALSLRMGRRPPPAVRLGIDARGIEVRTPKGSKLFPWADVTAWGLGSDYLWYELRRGPRAIVPFRAMSDRSGVEAVFRANRPAPASGVE